LLKPKPVVIGEDLVIEQRGKDRRPRNSTDATNLAGIGLDLRGTGNGRPANQTTSVSQARNNEVIAQTYKNQSKLKLPGNLTDVKEAKDQNIEPELKIDTRSDSLDSHSACGRGSDYADEANARYESKCTDDYQIDMHPGDTSESPDPKKYDFNPKK
jgi:hypothetical protein